MAQAHKLGHGLTEEIPYFKKQERLTFARCGITDPLSIADYRKHGGFDGLVKALKMMPLDIVTEVTTSGLRGRGGAGFPTGIKWKTVHDIKTTEQKYVACNADEGDSGTFADRMLMEGDPFCLIEGMTIAAIAGGATKGYIYIRSEYPHAVKVMRDAIEIARKANWLGDKIQGSNYSFDLFVRVGAGAYICGEETSMLESIEGKRGIVRFKPPIPAIEGLFGKPTIINNVMSFAAVPIILDKGGEFYKNYGVGRSRGTLAFQIAGNIKQGGLVEKAFGVTTRQLIDDWGGGTATGQPVRAVQVGGPLGAYLPQSKLDVPMDYEEFIKVDAMVGHGGLVVFDDTCRYGKDGPFRHGILRHRELRQVHAVPHRFAARRRGDRQDHRRRQPRQELDASRRPVRDHDGRIAVRHGRVDPNAGDERRQRLPGRFPAQGAPNKFLADAAE